MCGLFPLRHHLFIRHVFRFNQHTKFFISDQTVFDRFWDFQFRQVLDVKLRLMNHISYPSLRFNTSQCIMGNKDSSLTSQTNLNNNLVTTIYCCYLKKI